MLHLPLAANVNFNALAEVIFFLVMGFLWLINRISTAVETARRPPPPVRRPVQPLPPADGPQAQQIPPGQRAATPVQARTAAESLQNEIDEFLRRATGRQQPPQQPQRPGQPQRQRPAVGPRPAISVSRSDPRRGKAATVIVRQKSNAPSVEPLETPEAISDHVKQFLDTRSFEQRSSHLSSIDEKERQFDQKIQQTFSHEVGHLKPSTLSVGGDSASSASVFQQPAPASISPLANMLRGRIDLRKAIVLNEILQRPESRWS